MVRGGGKRRREKKIRIRGKGNERGRKTEARKVVGRKRKKRKK